MFVSFYRSGGSVWFHDLGNDSFPVVPCSIGNDGTTFHRAACVGSFRSDQREG